MAHNDPKPSNSDHSPPSRLAPLMRPQAPAEVAWREDELAAMLRHQMAAGIRPDVAERSAELGRRWEESAAAGDGSRDDLRGATFGQLLHHPGPPAEALAVVKDFAKAARDDPDGAPPAEIAAVLYYASIAVARMRCGRRISAMPDESLRRGAEWALANAWVEEPTRSLFRTWLEFLRAAADAEAP